MSDGGEGRLERLQKVIATAGLASRRTAEAWIEAGRVRVNGEVVATPGVRVDPFRDRIEVDGRPLPAPDPPATLLLHKPAGVVTTVRDPEGRRTVLDLVPKRPRLVPVGRLDYATSGLLLLSNEGALVHGLTHPSRGVEKVYAAWVEGYPGPETLQRLRKGVLLEDGWTAPAGCRLLQRGRGRSLIEIRLHEGRNRQIRRMCAALGHPVIELCRTGYAFLTLAGLRPGEWRWLEEGEVERLRALAQVPSPQR